jgi:polyhydroxybutyrate depolymerase
MLKSAILFVLLVFTCCTVSCTMAFGSGSREKNFRTEVQWISDGDRKGTKFQYGPGDYGRKLKISGQKRFYEMHVPPSYSKATPMPVVLVFHGGGGDPGTIRYESDMDRTADREGFIVVYPAGTNKRLLIKDRLLLWNDGRPLKDGSYSTADDVGFVAALLDDLTGMFNIHTKMIYACGYSNGAQFTYRLAKRLSNRIAAIAAVAGQRPAKDSFDSPPSRPMSIMQFAGLEDKVSPYYGGKPQTGDAEIKADAYAVKEAIESWVTFNKCPSKPAEIKKIVKAEMYRYGPCQDGNEVVLWNLEDGGHTWPGGKVVPNVELLGLGKMGNVNRDIKASDLMWEFFKKHPLKNKG